jgi:hypothetical protein
MTDLVKKMARVPNFRVGTPIKQYIDELTARVWYCRKSNASDGSHCHPEVC